MGIISLQMIDNKISSLWWKELIKYFMQIGDFLELRCWKEETNEIQHASAYGNPMEDNYEVSVKGEVSKKLIRELLSENLPDKSIYNKMTKYFTINTTHNQRIFCSAHYGTEIYIIGATNEDIAFFENVMKPYTEENFSITIDR